MPVKTVFAVIIFVTVAKFAKSSNFSGFIVGGETANIERFPYSAFVSKVCSNVSATCGASILNQAILLTAAHCVIRCLISVERMDAYTGSEVKYKGFKSKVIGFKIHEAYSAVTKANDIALLKLGTELTFGPKVKRVALVKEMPKYSTAIIAGWGWIDSVGSRGDFLKYATQELIDQAKCSQLLDGIPLGTVCGTDEAGYPEKGDSGSALIVDDFVQIGLVSFKKREYTNATIVYTDVAYFYDWIMQNSAKLNCEGVETLKASKTNAGSREMCLLGKARRTGNLP